MLRELTTVTGGTNEEKLTSILEKYARQIIDMFLHSLYISNMSSFKQEFFKLEKLIGTIHIN